MHNNFPFKRGVIVVVVVDIHFFVVGGGVDRCTLGTLLRALVIVIPADFTCKKTSICAYGIMWLAEVNR